MHTDFPQTGAVLVEYVVALFWLVVILVAVIAALDLALNTRVDAAINTVVDMAPCRKDGPFDIAQACY